MIQQPVTDPLLFHIISELNHFGEEDSPLRLIKDGHNYIIGFERRDPLDERIWLDFVCRITFIKSRSIWKLYWMSGDRKWHLYNLYEDFDEALEEVRNDPHGYFWGTIKKGVPNPQ